MRIFLRLITLFIIIAAAYFASMNTNLTVNLTFWAGKSHSVNFVYVVLALLIAGIIAGFAWSWAYYMIADTKLKEYKRKLEQTSVNADCSDSRVNVLESKIEVLEKALKSALEKNND